MIKLVDVNRQFHSISNDYGKLLYIKITVDYRDVDAEDYCPTKCLFCKEYEKTLTKPCTFYYIAFMEIYPAFRRQGKGRKLFMQFYNICAPDIVLLDCGLLDTTLIDELSDEEKIQYLEENVKPFWQKMGFFDVRYIDDSKDSIQMIYPKKEAERLDAIYGVRW